MWQRRWIGPAAAWVVGIEWFSAAWLPDVYEASARICVDTRPS
jgi:hypothetical protein